MMMPAKPQDSPEVSIPIQQICITHCLREEGLYKQAGFTVRATSTLDPLLLRFALEYPSYELPAGMAGEKSSWAPRRLALVRVPGSGQSALIHTVFVPDDRGRANNFFSHILIRPGLTAREALLCWDSPDWRTSCSPEDGTNLPPFEELPAADAINDEAVSAFLQPVASGTDTGGGQRFFPRRLANEAEKRRQLLRLALRGCMLAMQAGPTAPRNRFYLLAEPGLTALLVYAAVRLMPEAVAANLTFSTYENAHRDLRMYKHARVVGTYLSDPSRGLDAELYTTRGYALDTFAHQFSPELSGEAEPGIEEWIDLAARGDWPTIDKVHGLVGKTSTALIPFQEGLKAAKIAIRMSNGEATGDDLLTLKHAPWGEALLEEHRDKLWPIVRESSLNNERVRQEFAGVLREHWSDLESEAARALAEQPPGDWQPAFHLLCSLAQDDPAKLRDMLQRVLPEPPYAPGLRLALLTELDKSHWELSPVDPRASGHALLKNCTEEELDQLARSELPLEWIVMALLHALARTECRAAAAHHVHAGDHELLTVFWEQFRLLSDEGQRRSILRPLFPPDEPVGIRFLERFLVHRPRLRGETVEWLLDRFGAFSKSEESAVSRDFWGRDNHLGLLVDLLRGLGEEAEPLWDRLCAMLDPVLLAPGDSFQNTLLMELAAVNERPGPTLPPKTVQTIADWILLREHFERATDVPESTRRQIIDACNRQRFDSIEVLGHYFARFLLPQGMKKAVLDDFLGFFHSFFLAGMEHQDYSARLIAWLQIVSCCTDESLQAAYQMYYLENHIPLAFRWRLAEETHRAGRLLPAVFEQLQTMRPKEAENTAAAQTPTPTTGPADELFQLVGVHPADSASSLLASVAKRAPWLLGTLAGGLLAAGLSSIYKVQLQRVAAMVLFIPLVLSLAESASLQSLALTLRALRDSTFTGADLRRRLGREVLIGALLGLVCGVLVTIVAGVWTRSWLLAQTLGISLAGGLAAASAFGCLLPWLLRSPKAGRRIAGGPLTRSLAGLLALFIYFGLACLMIRR
ncbi:MAG TPA: magnesium transporter [Gemmataceae bacterium]|nr:magnesium transporter [Gemmataceae bacterium]